MWCFIANQIIYCQQQGKIFCYLLKNRKTTLQNLGEIVRFFFCAHPIKNSWVNKTLCGYFRQESECVHQRWCGWGQSSVQTSRWLSWYARDTRVCHYYISCSYIFDIGEIILLCFDFIQMMKVTRMQRRSRRKRWVPTASLCHPGHRVQASQFCTRHPNIFWGPAALNRLLHPKSKWRGILGIISLERRGWL